MKKTVYTCDKCGQEIDGVAYAIDCCAIDTKQDGMNRLSTEAAVFNLNQTMRSVSCGETKRHLCQTCKDKIADGLFIF